MEKYRFVSDYTTNVSVGGVVGIMPRTFKAVKFIMDLIKMVKFKFILTRGFVYKVQIIGL